MDTKLIDFRRLGECDCACHRSKHVKHIMPCCYPMTKRIDAEEPIVLEEDDGELPSIE